MKSPNSKRIMIPKFSKSHQKLPKDKTDYFDLLFDETRSRFHHTEAEGLTDFTEKEVMDKILTQGFRDPEYFSARSTFKLKEVRSEPEIRETYRFKLPVIVSQMENSKTEEAHVLGDANNDIKYMKVRD